MNIEKALRNLKKVKREMEEECLYKTNIEYKARQWLELVDDAISFLDDD